MPIANTTNATLTKKAPIMISVNPMASKMARSQP